MTNRPCTTTLSQSVRASSARDRIVFGTGIAVSAVVFLWLGLSGQQRTREYVASIAENATAGIREVHFAPPVASAEALLARFAEMGYHLADVRTGAAVVPRAIVTRIPSDIESMDSVDDRKALFVKALLPLVLEENQAILKDRARLEELYETEASGKAMTLRETAWLERLAERYGLERVNLVELRRRVDAVPPSLAIAQAAVETGWGTSRLAQKGHALFGQRAANGEDHQTFGAPADAVRAYINNLNTHNAYREFRERRAAQRAKDMPLDGMQLANFLKRYSERGRDYIKDVRTVIRANDLHMLDSARLANQNAVSLRPS
jgi:Bax protein